MNIPNDQVSATLMLCLVVAGIIGTVVFDGIGRWLKPECPGCGNRMDRGRGWRGFWSVRRCAKCGRVERSM